MVLLQPRVLDERVGIREMDVQNPGLGVPGITDPSALGLEGALKAPETQSTPWEDREPFETALTNLINLPEDLKEKTEDGEDEESPDPTITPPLYGRWHAVVKRLRESDNPLWIDQLNLDPRNRAVSGFGTLVVQKQQEELMNAAWQQVGRIDKANRLLRRAQFAREVSLFLYNKHLSPLDPNRLLSFTAPVHARVLGSPFTIKKLVGDSKLPDAGLNRAFRRIARPRGPVAKQIYSGAPPRPRPILERLNQGEVTAAPPKTAPEKQISINEISERLFPSWVPDWLKPWLRWSHWMVLGILVLFILLNLIFSFLPLTSPIFLAVVGALAAGFVFLRRQSRRGEAAENLREEHLTPESIAETPPRPGFRITHPGDTIPSVGAGGSDSPEAANFRKAALELHGQLQADLPQPPVRQPLDFAAVQTSLLTTLHPNTAIPKRILTFVNIPESPQLTRPDPIATIMAAPDFPQPMYKPLRDISPELLIPNLNLIPQNTIALLKTNQPFIEGYMVGLNHEMSRELLWREFPTDQRGSYFRQFWDVSDFVSDNPDLTPEEFAEKLKDIPPIHKWPRDANLGDNNNRPLEGDEGRLVLAIRGDLLKKYPTAVIIAIKAQWPEDGNSRTLSDEEKSPIFKAKIDPDITFIGFDLTEEEARGSSKPEDNEPGWFFGIKQRAGEPRFGLDVAGAPATETEETWNDLSWGHLAATGEAFDALNYIELTQGLDLDEPKPLHNVDIDPTKNPDNVDWGTQAADMAYITYQDPVFIAVHASEMLPPEEGSS